VGSAWSNSTLTAELYQQHVNFVNFFILMPHSQFTTITKVKEEFDESLALLPYWILFDAR
jgi:hypothetical protein